MSFTNLFKWSGSVPVFETSLLLAGKLHARLRNALAQTGWAVPVPEAESWRQIVCERLKTLDWKASLADLRPFLEKTQEIELLTPDYFTRLLSCS